MSELTVLVHCFRVPIESLGKNFATLVIKFFPTSFIGNTYRIYMKKLEYKSYKVFSYRFYSFVPIIINSACLITKNLIKTCLMI